jgi:hypothetical protein
MRAKLWRTLWFAHFMYFWLVCCSPSCLLASLVLQPAWQLLYRSQLEVCMYSTKLGPCKSVGVVMGPICVVALSTVCGPAWRCT